MIENAGILVDTMFRRHIIALQNVKELETLYSFYFMFVDMLLRELNYPI